MFWQFLVVERVLLAAALGRGDERGRGDLSEAGYRAVREIGEVGVDLSLGPRSVATCRCEQVDDSEHLNAVDDFSADPAPLVSAITPDTGGYERCCCRVSRRCHR